LLLWVVLTNGKIPTQIICSLIADNLRRRMNPNIASSVQSNCIDVRFEVTIMPSTPFVRYWGLKLPWHKIGDENSMFSSLGKWRSIPRRVNPFPIFCTLYLISEHCSMTGARVVLPLLMRMHGTQSPSPKSNTGADASNHKRMWEK
jgi:hypothetical protein